MGNGSVCTSYVTDQIFKGRFRRISTVLLEVGDGMLVLITYDVNTQTSAGKRRLRKVAKECQNYGQRVQNSVFECIMDNAKAKEVKAKLLEIIDMDKDSLRFYYLGNVYKNKVEHYGTRTSIDLEGTLII